MVAQCLGPCLLMQGNVGLIPSQAGADLTCLKAKDLRHKTDAMLQQIQERL